ncbi:MAG: GNAT family N-acetyltransferase [Bacteroidetes bacterium]|nr:GNAT family N-acetyltransferase [Bacteroidota bacterium]
MKLNLIRTTSENADFRKLIPLLDADLRIRDGNEHAFFAQYNKIDAIKHVVVAFFNEEPVGCGAFKPFEAGVVEIKRMYVLPAHRGRGIAAAMLRELEMWAADEGNEQAVLETGKKMPEAIGLYQKSGYVFIPNFGQYAGVESCVCMGKQFNSAINQ